jgi:hypothetical protein
VCVCVCVCLCVLCTTNPHCTTGKRECCVCMCVCVFVCVVHNQPALHDGYNLSPLC